MEVGSWSLLVRFGCPPGKTPYRSIVNVIKAAVPFVDCQGITSISGGWLMSPKEKPPGVKSSQKMDGGFCQKNMQAVSLRL